MKINFKKLDHIQICIPLGKENEARKFYLDILGFNEIPKPIELLNNGGFWCEAGGIRLHIGVEDETNNSKRHPAFEVENLDEVKQYLISKNIQLKEDTQISGVKRFSIFDPFGNRIELLEKE
jgi:catechol-2,3-dioxygenase